MICPHCGARLPDGTKFCSRCGSRLAPSEGPFAQAQRRHQDLLERLRRGDIDDATFQRERSQLVVRDASGQSWLPSPREDQWYLWDGQSWVLRKRERAAPPARMRAVPRPKPEPARARAPRKSRRGLILGIGALGLLVCVVAIGIHFLQGRGTDELARLSPTPMSGTSVVEAGETPESLAAVAAPTIGPAPRVFVSSFDGGASPYFAAGSAEGGEVIFADDAYCFHVTQVDTSLQSTSDLKLTNLALEVDATLLSGPDATGYGLLLRATDASGADGLFFEVNSSGQWRVRSRSSDGQYADLRPWTSSEAIDKGAATNLIAALAQGPNVTFYVNGEELGRIEDAPVGGTFVGLIASTPAGQADAHVCFDLLRAEEILDQPPDDRQLVRAELGLPQSFGLSFELDDEDILHRYETWVYYDYLTEFTFADGVLMESQPLEPIDSLIIAPEWYNPFDFTPDMTLDNIKTLLQDDELAELAIPEELGEEMVLYAGEQIVVGFTGGELEYVETLALGAPVEEGSQ